MRFSCFSTYLTSTYLSDFPKENKTKQKLKCLLCFVKFLKHKLYQNYSILVSISLEEKKYLASLFMSLHDLALKGGHKILQHLDKNYPLYQFTAKYSK